MWARITLLTLVMSSAVGAAGWPLEKIRTVNITNNLGANIELNFHCKSKNDDLGQQQLPYKGFWYFKFRPNFWGTTLFYCSMNWEQLKGENYEKWARAIQTALRAKKKYGFINESVKQLEKDASGLED
ncbi:self-incompatibility protein S1 [Manihot esculenta]|uniref:self-incompatibility protein S1 n=1 Tax=Manihot esculenta TaxID=3983 RepID=UPI000B5D1806|nr:self-incompatibility protein S1 [Manihot esculenta]